MQSFKLELRVVICRLSIQILNSREKEKNKTTFGVQMKTGTGSNHSEYPFSNPWSIIPEESGYPSISRTSDNIISIQKSF